MRYDITFRRRANTIPHTKYARTGVNIIYIEHTATKNYAEKVKRSILHSHIE